MFLKEQFIQKWKHQLVVPNLYDFLSSTEHKDVILWNVSAVFAH